MESNPYMQVIRILNDELLRARLAILDARYKLGNGDSVEEVIQSLREEYEHEPWAGVMALLDDSNQQKLQIFMNNHQAMGKDRS